MYLRQAVDVFIADRKVNGCTKATVAFYEYTLGSLCSFVGRADVQEIGQHVTPYFLSLHERDLSQCSQHTHFRGVRAFTNFLHTERYVDAPIELPKMKNGQPTVKPLSPEQVTKALHSLDARRFTGLRDQTIVRMLFDTGVRLSELSGIDLQDVSFEDGFAFVRGKGRKERWVPFGKETRKALWTYMKQRERVATAGESALFVTQSGNRLTPRGVQMIFKRLAKKLNLDGVRFSPHTMRHSFALAYIENGGDPFSLQRILGHSTQAMTSKYINMARSNVKAQHERYSPGDRV